MIVESLEAQLLAAGQVSRIPTEESAANLPSVRSLLSSSASEQLPKALMTRCIVHQRNATIWIDSFSNGRPLPFSGRQQAAAWAPSNQNSVQRPPVLCKSAKTKPSAQDSHSQTCTNHRDRAHRRPRIANDELFSPQHHTRGTFLPAASAGARFGLGSMRASGQPGFIGKSNSPDHDLMQNEQVCTNPRCSGPATGAVLASRVRPVACFSKLQSHAIYSLMTACRNAPISRSINSPEPNAYRETPTPRSHRDAQY